MSTITADSIPPPTTAAASTTTTTTSPTVSSTSSHPKPSSVSPSLTSPSTTNTTDRQVAEARAALEASMHNIGSNLDATLKSRATNLHANNTVLNTQIKELEKETAKLKKETDRLKQVADNAQRKIKETGNVQNWAEVMEREFLILEETVRLVEESEGGESDYGPCRVCGVYVEAKDPTVEGDGLLWCRGCEGEFHAPCVGLEYVPAGEWVCAECEHQGTYLMDVKGGSKGGLAKIEDDSEVGLDGVIVDDIDMNSGDIEMGGINSHSNKKGKGKEKEEVTEVNMQVPPKTEPAPNEPETVDTYMELHPPTVTNGVDFQNNHSTIPIPTVACSSRWKQNATY